MAFKFALNRYVGSNREGSCEALTRRKNHAPAANDTTYRDDVTGEYVTERRCHTHTHWPLPETRRT